MSFNRIKSGEVTGLLTGHNTLRRYVYIMGMIDSPLGRRCGAEEETLAHILCEYEVLMTDILIWVPFSWTLRMVEG